MTRRPRPAAPAALATAQPVPDYVVAQPAASDAKWLGYSRTVWLNVAAAVLVFLEHNTALLQPLLPVNFYAALAVVLPMANITLRILTTQAVSLTKPAVTAPAPNQPE